MSGLGNNWKKSTRSNGSDNCVEARTYQGEVQVRDTKDRTGGTLSFSPEAWADFLSGIRAGEFDAS
ncbi:DUF397 domain-containing protein [Actinoplanes sp. HUAS TT8]|uniref:DUF397 domain-containing protein n=1 Tax=Actinoplanes sp. HUAS TT8 TaxID=3447453 RepID=UPI003F51C37A